MNNKYKCYKMNDCWSYRDKRKMCIFAYSPKNAVDRWNEENDSVTGEVVSEIILSFNDERTIKSFDDIDLELFSDALDDFENDNNSEESNVSYIRNLFEQWLNFDNVTLNGNANELLACFIMCMQKSLIRGLITELHYCKESLFKYEDWFKKATQLT